MRRLFPILVLAPAQALAEGAVQTLDCIPVAVCDEAGACESAGAAAGEPMTFRIEPVSVGALGEGDYLISYGDVSAPMTNVSGTGPLLWSEGLGDRQVILFTGEANLLWQSFDAGAARSVVSFLSCEVTQ